jgi:RNA polymerase sigma-70 factor (ECF subfamily)
MQHDPPERRLKSPFRLEPEAGGSKPLTIRADNSAVPARPRSRIVGAADIGWEANDPRSDVSLGHSPVELTITQRELFDTLYREHFDFVFRNLRRLGVVESGIDDALQDVYMVALRRIGEFRGTHAKAWLFAILLRVSGNHRRSQRRRGSPVQLVEERIEAPMTGPFDQAAQQQARQILHRFLERLDDNPRATFVMAELEQMTAPEIGEALSANVNTVYSWLRAARADFVQMLRAMHESEGPSCG